jgi:hypothetical protein
MTELTDTQKSILADLKENGWGEKAAKVAVDSTRNPQGVLAWASGVSATLNEVLSLLRMLILVTQLSGNSETATDITDLANELQREALVASGLVMYATFKILDSSDFDAALAEMERTKPEAFADVVSTYESLVNAA